MRCLTLNTWKNEGDYAARLRAMAAGMKQTTPDIVLLQEVFRTVEPGADTGRSLAQTLGMRLVYAPARLKKRRWEGREVPSESGLAILVRGEAAHVECVPLPSDAAGGERIALLVDAQVDGATVLVGCTHLSHLRADHARRREQLETILRHPRWRAPAALRVLGGDFNAECTSPELAWLREHPTLRVTDLLASCAATGGTHPLPPRAGGSARRIDFLFSVGPRTERAPRLVRAGIALDAPIDGVWPSDHAAAVAEFELT